MREPTADLRRWRRRSAALTQRHRITDAEAWQKTLCHSFHPGFRKSPPSAGNPSAQARELALARSPFFELAGPRGVRVPTVERRPPATHVLDRSWRPALIGPLV